MDTAATAASQEGLGATMLAMAATTMAAMEVAVGTHLLLPRTLLPQEHRRATLDTTTLETMSARMHQASSKCLCCPFVDPGLCTAEVSTL